MSDDSILKWLWRANAHLAWAAKSAVVVFAMVMVTSIALQVGTRAALNWSPPWTEEVALLMFAWIIFFMIAIGVREHLHVKVDILLERLGPPAVNLAQRATSVLIAGVGAYLAWSGTDYLLETRGAVSAAIRYPSELLYTAVPLSGILLFLFSLENAVRGWEQAKSVAAE